MTSLAPDSTEVLDEALALWERHIGEEWRPGDIDAVSFMAHILRKTGKRISRSTASKWLADQAAVGVYQRIDGVVHPQTRRRTTVYRQPAVPQPPAPPLPEVPAGDDDGDQRRARPGVRRVSSKGRK